MQNWNPLDGRKAVVTGAGLGIGAAIARTFAAAGAEVVLAARTRSQLEQVADEIIQAGGPTPHVVTADMGDTAQVEALARQSIELMGGVDIVVSNAAYQIMPTKLLDLAPGEFEQMQKVNVGGTLTLLRGLVPQMKGRAGANVIIVSSIRGLNGVPTGAAYGASKAALNHLTKSLACEWGVDGVRVNGLLPGPVDTPRVANQLKGNQALYDYYGNIAPIPGWTTSEDCAEPALFLASDAARRITGQLLVVDGGLSILSQDSFPPPKL